MFTMYFGGGTIPNYVLVRKLGMMDTRAAMIIPGAMSVYNMIIARTFINNIPSELEEAAKVDGCTDTRFFLQTASGDENEDASTFRSGIRTMIVKTPRSTLTIA